MDTEHLTLSRRVSKRRQSLGLSVRRAARLIGCSHSNLLRVESGEQRPTPALLESIARVLDLPLRELFALAGHPIPKELPDVGEYVRLKYHDLPLRARDELTEFLTSLQDRYGAALPPPTDGRDEQPEGLR